MTNSNIGIRRAILLGAFGKIAMAASFGAPIPYRYST
jgi:hypothetical protein